MSEPIQSHNRHQSPNSSEVKVSHDTYISTINYCQSNEASHLCIFDSYNKLNNIGEYNIGGTYSDTNPDLWFYFTSSSYYGPNHLLNLFVCQRKPGSVSIQVSDSNEYALKNLYDENVSCLVFPNILSRAYTFKSTKPDEHHYIKTYTVYKTISLSEPVSTLMIPIKININPAYIHNEDIVNSIKLQHNLSGLLAKQENTDFVLESVTHKQYPTHKILLAAHSPVLRVKIKNESLTSLFIDISDNDMELLQEFIYTGTIKSIMKQDCLNLLEIADKFQLKPLFLLAQHVIGNQINISNAVEIAVVAKKYNLEELQNKVFKFIAINPKVMKTDAWLNLKDVELTKYMFQYMHTIKD